MNISRITLLGLLTQSSKAFSPRNSVFKNNACSILPPLLRQEVRCFSSPPQLSHIGLKEMKEVVEDYEEGGREDSMYVIIDVRNPDEIMYTGKLSPSTHTLPLPLIMEKQAFQMEEDDFEEEFGFQKPSLDETLVFSCAAGIRSVYAAKAAAQAGYTNLVNYAGGANEWFSGPR